MTICRGKGFSKDHSWSLFLSLTVVMDRESMRPAFGSVFLSDGTVLHGQDGGHPQSDAMAQLMANCFGLLQKKREEEANREKSTGSNEASDSQEAPVESKDAHAASSSPRPSEKKAKKKSKKNNKSKK